MDHLAAADLVPSLHPPLDISRIRAGLTDLERDLGRLTSSADADFLKIGNHLGRAVSVFERLGLDFADLAEKLEGEEAASATSALELAVSMVRDLSGEKGRIAPLLTELEAAAADVEKRLNVLARIVGEVQALATNGKILAAVATTAAGGDFSVFTTEIGRLGLLAEASTRQALKRLESVHATLVSARDAETAFESHEAKELDDVRSRLTSGLSVLAQRRRKVASAAQIVAEKSREITRRIGRTVGELQINDNICQRIEHVRRALRASAALTGGAVSAESGAWERQIAEERRPGVIGGMCRLQIAQLTVAAKDYNSEIEGLIQNLTALTTDAGGIVTEAERAFGGAGGGLFVAEIEQDVKRASALLHTYTEARDRTRTTVEAASQGIRAMAADLEAIQSIDADMRIMGLNATLKCGRLGTAGRALGVVAQELRGCSNRTEDCAQDISHKLKAVLTLAEKLAELSSRSEQAGEPDLTALLAGSMASLSTLGHSMSNALTDLGGKTGTVSADLSKAAAEIDIHHRVRKASEDGVSRLNEIVDVIGLGLSPDDSVYQDLSRLMLPIYTMDRERNIHQSLGDGRPLSSSPQVETEQAAAEEDLEDFFL